MTRRIALSKRLVEIILEIPNFPRPHQVTIDGAGNAQFAWPDDQTPDIAAAKSALIAASDNPDIILKLINATPGPESLEEKGTQWFLSLRYGLLLPNELAN